MFSRIVIVGSCFNDKPWACYLATRAESRENRRVGGARQSGGQKKNRDSTRAARVEFVIFLICQKHYVRFCSTIFGNFRQKLKKSQTRRMTEQGSSSMRRPTSYVSAALTPPPQAPFPPPGTGHGN